MRRSWIGYLFAIALAASNARADADPVAVARERKREGDVAMANARAAEALVAYDAAYALAPEPTLLYNRARANLSMGRYVEALDLLQAFDRDAPAELRDRIKTLPELIRDVQMRVATLELSCAAAGATVMIGERDLGVTPLPPTQVSAGRVTLRVLHPSYFPYVREVVMPGASVARLNVALVPRASALVTVRAMPLGSEIVVDGRRIGNAPSEVEVAPGEHDVLLEREGYSSARHHIVVAAGEQRMLDVTLEKSRSPSVWLWVGAGVAAVLLGGAVVWAATHERARESGDIPPGQVPVGH